MGLRLGVGPVLKISKLIVILETSYFVLTCSKCVFDHYVFNGLKYSTVYRSSPLQYFIG